LAHLRNLSAKGFERFVLFGYAGEGASFTNDEKLSALKRVISEGVEPSNICLGINTSAIVDAVTLINKAYEKGVKRFLVTPPIYYQPLVNESITDYFENLLKRVGLADWQLYIHQLGGAADAPEAHCQSCIEVTLKFSAVLLTKIRTLTIRWIWLNHLLDKYLSFRLMRQTYKSLDPILRFL